ncbi:P-type conjugative transfer protein TrbL [Asticcacaulis taihuensis]|uniref:Type IV secretion system protein TrbL n=1 Tax=Asticcacaulis taihuensis TaxID=260084 RepID=A0A1G4PTV2_9CAUL|nr:P-type conjugative transfer protein TrbL [Asticcacaulis taihuensis]SCW35686.1 type IV secretion system protein TrbL [Asticcacaulis taihuensis]
MDLNIVDQFLAVFSQYLDTGFGLLKGDVGHLASILIAIDVTLAALFWLLDEEAHILSRLIRKILFVGAFAYIINNFKHLADLIFRSFSTLGLDASANTLSASDLLKPGRLAGIGFDAAQPLMTQLADLMGLDTFFSNFLTIAVLLIVWLLVILSFFVLAIQLFITILEFKLTTLAGFTLVPFALWNKTAFLAERVLGNVVTSGIKVMVLAVIVGIGSSFFGQYVTGLNGATPSLVEALTLALASLTLLGLGIFGPTVASGLVSGAPQLGAGAAVGTAAAAVGAGLLAGGAARAVLGGGASALGAIKAAAGVPKGPGNSSSPPAGGSPSGAPGPGPQRPGGGGPPTTDTVPPAWARRQHAQHQRQTQIHMVQSALSSGDQGGSGPAPDIADKS